MMKRSYLNYDFLERTLIPYTFETMTNERRAINNLTHIIHIISHILQHPACIAAADDNDTLIYPLTYVLCLTNEIPRHPINFHNFKTLPQKSYKDDYETPIRRWKKSYIFPAAA